MLSTPLTRATIVLSALVALMSAARPALAVQACETVTALTASPGGAPLQVTLAQQVPPGGFSVPAGAIDGPPGAANPYAALPAFCRVAVTLRPGPKSDIKAEVWMPVAGWNGKLQVVGNGGFAGTIGYRALATALAAGYAAASTDTGHTGPAANTFANEDADARLRLSGDPRDGRGRQARRRSLLRRARRRLCVLQRLLDRRPPGADRGAALSRRLQRHRRRRAGDLHHRSRRSARSGSTRPSRSARVRFRKEKLPLIHDGGADCVRRARRRGGRRAREPARVHVRSAACSPARPGRRRRVPHGAAGRRRTQGLCGADARHDGREDLSRARARQRAWVVAGAGRLRGGLLQARRVQEPVVGSGARSNFGSHVAEAYPAAHQIFDANDPAPERVHRPRRQAADVSGLGRAGHPARPHRELLRGRCRRRRPMRPSSVRLFMVPGMGHCGGGDGASTFNMVAALDAWVERGTAPEQIPASRVRNGAVDRTRPLCAYPRYARYSGSGVSTMPRTSAASCRRRGGRPSAGPYCWRSSSHVSGFSAFSSSGRCRQRS